MIYDMASVKNKYKDVRNLSQKIFLEIKKELLVRVRRGLYSDDFLKDLPIIANVCYGPSYISFEYALSYYGLIPEYVSVLTSATYGKKNRKFYQIKGAAFEYRSVPKEVFPFEVDYLENENGIRYKIATREKALCDELYSKYPVRSIKDLKIMLFDDLRIDEFEFLKLNFKTLKELCDLYHSNTLYTLKKYIRELEKNDNND